MGVALVIVVMVEARKKRHSASPEESDCKRALGCI